MQFNGMGYVFLYLLRCKDLGDEQLLLSIDEEDMEEKIVVNGDLRSKISEKYWEKDGPT